MKEENIIKRLESMPVSLLQIYQGRSNDKTRLDVRCNTCNHFWNVTLSGLIYDKHGCPKCSAVRRGILRSLPISILDDKITESTRGLISRIGPYINSTTKTQWRCNICQNEFSASASHFIHGKNYGKHRCPKCNKHEPVTDERIDRLLSEYGGNIKRYDNCKNCMVKMKWQCAKCDGIWSARPNDVLSTHRSGCPYCRKKNYSKKAVEWLTQIERQERISIQHAGKGYEYKIPGTRFYVDGFCYDNNTVYEFHGNAFHGNPRMYMPTDTCHPYDVKLTAGLLYEKTLKREHKLISLGYKLVIMWEDVWDSQL